MSIRWYVICLIYLGLASSCTHPKQVGKVLKISGDNRENLEKVIQYFSESDNPEHLKAVYFLIGNMEQKYWMGGDQKDNYNPILDVIDSLWKAGVKVNMDSQKYLEGYWDSLTTIHGQPNLKRAKVFLDYEHLSAHYLINHIKQAFVARETLPWCRSLSFEDFCEYVLPYRIGIEAPESWNVHLWEKWQELRDTIKNPGRMLLAKIINDFNSYGMTHMRLFWGYPFDFTASEFERSRLGSCKHSVYYTAMAMRANGLPVGVDIVPQWAGSNAGHEWNVLLKEDGTFYPFDAVNKGFKFDYSFRKIAKVFRQTYQAQNIKLTNEAIDELPPSFVNYFRKDVTNEYVKTFDIKVPIVKFHKKREYAVISTFDNQNWAPQYWGEINGNEALFKNMGVGIVYSAFYYDQGQYHRASEPFLLDSLGEIHSLRADENQLQDMKLTRKYPLTSYMKNIMAFVVGNSIQGANQRNFSDSTTFFTIDSIPEKIETEYIKDEKRYRYGYHSFERRNHRRS